MAETLVWAYKAIPELNGETGFVACDEKLAKELIAADKAQDPAHGALHLKEIEPGTYKTKQVRRTRRKAVAVEDEVTDETEVSDQG